MVFELMMQNQLKKGLEEGERRGERRGMKKGLEKGMALNARKNAENLLKSGILTVEQIARDLEMPVEEVLDIQKSLAQV